jgi:hypothetical protein
VERPLEERGSSCAIRKLLLRPNSSVVVVRIVARRFKIIVIRPVETDFVSQKP